MGLVSVVKIGKAYSRHGDGLGVLSRAVRPVAVEVVLSRCGGDTGRGCLVSVCEPMGHRAAMRGRRRAESRGACAGVVGAAAVVGWRGRVSGTAEEECERVTTAIVRVPGRRGGGELGESRWAGGRWINSEAGLAGDVGARARPGVAGGGQQSPRAREASRSDTSERWTAPLAAASGEGGQLTLGCDCPWKHVVSLWYYGVRVVYLRLQGRSGRCQGASRGVERRVRVCCVRMVRR